VAPEAASVAVLSAAELAAVLVAVELELEPQAARPSAAAETPATFKKFLLEIFCMIIYLFFTLVLRVEKMLEEIRVRSKAGHKKTGDRSLLFSNSRKRIRKRTLHAATHRKARRRKARARH
jgi:hypothetical protein